MAATNERLLDAEIGHAVDQQRYSNWLVRRIIGILNKADADLISQLTLALDQMPPSSFSVERLESLLASVRQLNSTAYAAAGLELTAQLREYASYEAGYQLQLFQDVVPPQVVTAVGVNAVNLAQVEAAVLSRPFQGRLLKEWAQSMESDRMTRIRDAVRMGFVEGQTIDQIVRRVRGTRARGYADGIIEIDRRNAQAVVRTAVSHTAGTTRDKFYEDNDELIKELRWVSTLDGRTTPTCQIRDGKRYSPKTHRPIGHNIPWLGGPGRAHFCCRSISVPVLKSWRELGVDVDEFTPTTRASMNGQVPADLTFGDWIQKQSVKKQIEVLGPDRAALLRTGGVKPDKFFNDYGKYLTLDELKEKDIAAFDRAGLTLPIRPPRGTPQDEIARFLDNPEAQQALLRTLYSGEGQSFDAAVQRVRYVASKRGYTSSTESLSAIRYYTGSGYEPINRRMRETGGTLEDRQFTALTSSGLGGMRAYRGVIYRAPTTRAVNADAWFDRAVVGQPLDLGNQLQSYSTKPEFAASWAGNADVLLRIDNPKPGVYIEPISQFPGEHEVLLPPGLTYRVKAKSTRKVGSKEFRVIDLEIVRG